MANILALPNEILTEIFIAAVKASPKSFQPLTLACMRFSQIVLSSRAITFEVTKARFPVIKVMLNYENDIYHKVIKAHDHISFIYRYVYDVCIYTEHIVDDTQITYLRTFNGQQLTIERKPLNMYNIINWHFYPRSPAFELLHGNISRGVKFSMKTPNYESSDEISEELSSDEEL